MPELIYNDSPGAVPATYRFPPGLDARLSSVSAMFDGSGAGGSFLPCLSVYSQDNKLIGRFFAEGVSAGDSAEVTFAPFLSAAVAAVAAGSTSTALVQYGGGTLSSAGDEKWTGGIVPTSFKTNDPSRFSVGASDSYAHALLINAADCAVAVVAFVVYHTPFRTGTFRLNLIEDTVAPQSSVGTALVPESNDVIVRAVAATGQPIQQKAQGFYECNFPGQWGIVAHVANTALGVGNQAYDEFAIAAYTLGGQPT